MQRKDDTKTNHFGELPTAYYTARYREGKFYDAHTNEEIKLKDNALVRLQTHRQSVTDADYEQHIQKRDKKLFDANTEFSFDLEGMTFYVRIKDSLGLYQEGNRHSKLSSPDCVCEHYHNPRTQRHERIEPPIEAGSLNQMFTRCSVHFFPKKASHGCNVYKKFRFEGRVLEGWRAF